MEPMERERCDIGQMHLCALHLFDMDSVVLDSIADFVANSSRSLANLEIALGRHEVCCSLNHYLRWSRALGMEVGVWLNTSDSALPPSVALKQVLSLGCVSQAIECGWHGLSSNEFGNVFSFWERFADKRISLFHFDVCFGVEAAVALASFRQSAIDSPATIASTTVTCEVFGVSVPLRLLFQMQPRWNDRIEGLGPFPNLEVVLDLEQIRLPASGGPEDCLRITCEILCENAEIKSCSFLRKFDATGFVQALHEWHGLYKVEQTDPLLSFWPTAGGMCHIAELELYHGSDTSTGPGLVGRSWDVSRDLVGTSVRSAVWNARKRGTDLVPLIYMRDNDFACEVFSPGIFNGAVALLKRGGGLGFAQKASAAREAGAVGCIIYDSEKALSMNSWEGDDCMGLEFNDTMLADPGIPSLLVGKETSECLLAAVETGGAHVRIILDHSRESLWKPPPRYDAFMKALEDGNPIHVEVSFERIDQPPCDQPPWRSRRRQ